MGSDGLSSARNCRRAGEDGADPDPRPPSRAGKGVVGTGSPSLQGWRMGGVSGTGQAALRGLREWVDRGILAPCPPRAVGMEGPTPSFAPRCHLNRSAPALTCVVPALVGGRGSASLSLPWARERVGTTCRRPLSDPVSRAPCDPARPPGKGPLSLAEPFVNPDTYTGQRAGTAPSPMASNLKSALRRWGTCPPSFPLVPSFHGTQFDFSHVSLSTGPVSMGSFSRVCGEAIGHEGK